MTTDNRTNGLTAEQVEAAVKAVREVNCNVCGTGYMKRVLRRLVRRAGKDGAR